MWLPGWRGWMRSLTLLGKTMRRPRPRRAPRARPRLEPLEDRLTPAIIDTWIGAHQANDGYYHWNDLQNWSGGVPTNGDDLLFPGNVPGVSMCNDLVGLSVASLTFQVGGYFLRGNSLTVTGNITDTATGSGNTLTLPLVQQGTIPIAVTNSSEDLTLSGPISGSGGLTMSGQGTLTLTGANTYQGATVINGGVVQIENNQALGDAANPTTVNGGATLEVLNPDQGNPLDIPQPLTLNGSGFGGAGALQSNILLSEGPPSALNIWSGPITLNTDSAINVVPGAPLTITGPISGPGGMTKIGGDVLTLAGSTANTYAGTTNVSAGQLVLQKSPGVVAVPGDLVIGTGMGAVPADGDADGDSASNDSDSDAFTGVDGPAPPGSVQLQSNEQIADTANVTVNSDGLLDVNGFSETVGSLTGSGPVNLTAPPNDVGPGAAGTLAIGANGLPTTFAGVIQGDGGNLVKVGGGTFTLTGANTYTGTTTVNGGTLRVDGSQPASAVVVNAGGILGGHGIVGPTTVNAGGVVSPGDSPGVLSVQGGITFNPGSVLFAELNGPAIGTGYDALNVVGPVVLNNPLLRLAVGFTPPARQDFVLIANNGSGPILGAFAGAPEDALLAHGKDFFDISYAGAVDVLSQSRADLFVRALFADLDLASSRATRAPFEAQAEGGALALVAQELLGSPRRRLNEVELFYSVFGQPNDGLQGRYVAELLRGVPAGQVLVNFVSSRSFRRAHPGNRTFLRELFTALLGHPPGQHDRIGGHTLAYYLGQLNAGTISRGQLVLRLLTSDEVYAAAVQQNFATLLGMVPTGVQLQALTGQVLAGGLTPDTLTELVVTQEAYIDYFIARAATGRAPGVVLAEV